jgi:hypothetical protein
MQKLNVCIDIDSTVTMPDYWVRYANDYFDTDYEYNDDTVEEYFKENGFDHKKFDTFYHQFEEQMHETATIRPFAKKAIDNIKKFSNVYYVTARESHIEPITVQWLKNHHIYSTVYHLGSFEKNEKANELDCHIFIEDNLKTAKELAGDDIKVILIDTGFNRYENPENIERVYNWNEIYDSIKKYYDVKFKD